MFVKLYLVCNNFIRLRKLMIPVMPWKLGKMILIERKQKIRYLCFLFIWHYSYMSTFRVYSTCIPINVKRCRWEETLTAIRNIIPNRVTTMVYFPRICFFSYLLRWQLNQILITSNMFELTKFGYTNLHTNTRLESQTQQVRYSHMAFKWINKIKIDRISTTH